MAYLFIIERFSRLSKHGAVAILLALHMKETASSIKKEALKKIRQAGSNRQLDEIDISYFLKKQRKPDFIFKQI